MKKTLLFVFSLLLSVTMIAQTKAQFIKESFNGTNMPTGWTIAGLGQTSWSISQTANAGGKANELHLTWNPQFNGISRVVMPAVDLTGVDKLVFSFKHCLSNYSGSHTIGIATSSDGGTTWNEGWSQSYSQSNQFSVTEFIETPDMGNDNVLLCIYYSGNSYNINDWYFDDIDVYSMEQTMLAIQSINLPSSTAGSQFEVPFTVMNKGVETITTFEASYQFNELEEVTETFSCTLPSLATHSFSFGVPAELIPGSYEVKVRIKSVNNNTDINDELSQSFSVAMNSVQRIPLIEHFSSSTCVPCVSVNNAMGTFCNNNPGRYSYTKYQMNWPGSGDPYYTADGGVRRMYYAVNAVPNVVFNGTNIGAQAVQQTAFDNECNIPAFSDIKGSFSVDGNTINIIADFMSYVDLSNVRAFIAINEKVTTGNVGSNGETEFHHVFMAMPTTAQGETINIEAGDYVHMEKSFDMSSTFVEEMSDLEVALWLQNYSTAEVYNSAFALEYTEEHPYAVQNLQFTHENDGEDFVATWDAPQSGSPLNYNVYVNGELATTTNETTYSVAETEGFTFVEVEAVYANDLTSVKVAKTMTYYSSTPENVAESYSIYPNPTTNTITVCGNDIKEVQIFNICGQNIMTVNGTNNVKVNLSNYAAGIYMVKVIDNNGNSTVSKVIKK